MSDVYVDSELIFKAGATNKVNIIGNPNPERMTSVDWFDQTAINLTNDYTSTLGGANDAVALTAGGTNGVTLTTGTGDNEVSFLAGGLIFDITQEPEIESKVEMTDVSGTFAYFGFSDAVLEATPIATIDGAGGTHEAGATDAVGFVIDADFETSSIYLVSVKTGGAVQAVDTGLAYADGEAKRLKVALDSSGNARGYVDGIQVAYIASAVADVALCAIYNYGTRAADGSNTVIARHLKKWQNEA
ncbi:hypothetical protein LCGC14_1202460 [marine sediment metagenome]|uniref:Uncharacterized protein n=1 Tax=marine sediment metagenome TaxID=412755 RepID=A0A0F9LKY5_9ZZZZ